MTIVNAVLEIALAAAPWLLLGLLAAGLIRAFVPESVLRRWVGGGGLAGVSRAAFVGAPLPLCSCGAIPTAFALYRGGAGRGPTTAFLIGTPGIGVDSLAITYTLLGPLMMVARAAGAVVTAIATGLLVATTGERRAPPSATLAACGTDCCGGASSGEAAVAADPRKASFLERARMGIGYAFGELLDDIAPWLFAGLVLAGVLVALLPPQTLATVGSGLMPMLLMAVIGIPLYICATAATPIAAGMLVAGVSPGTVLVFLLAGPITSMATLGVLRREMGGRAVAAYLLGIGAVTVLTGLLVDQVVARAGVDVVAQLGAARELLPDWLKATALVVLIALAVRPVRRVIGRRLPV